MGKIKDYGGWAVVTGASAGIGQAFARHLAREGVNCFLVARRGDRLETLAEELRAQHGVQARAIVCDLGDTNCVNTLRADIGETPIGMLINNAGFGAAGAFAESDPERIALMVRVNCLAPAILTRHFLPQMLARKNGAVITVGSTLALVPCPYEATYAATKAFDLSFSEGLYHELNGTGVDVLCVCPALTETEFMVAEGVSEERAKEIYRRADPPEKIARIAFDALGRHPVVGPRDFKMLNFSRRLLPRKMTGAMVGKIMKGLIAKGQA